jgi:hypothetical protein
MRPVPEQVAAFVRAAIADRYQAGEIPDQKLLAGQDPVLIFDETERPAYRLSEQALPTGGQTRFALIARAAARDRARGSWDGTRMIEVGGVEVGPESASLVLGISISPDLTRPSLIVMCCCSARANYRLRDGRWVFTGWGEENCRP